MTTPCSFSPKPPRLALLLLVNGLALHWLLFSFTFGGVAQLVVGSVIFTGGLAMMLWAWALFRHEQTPVCHRETPTKLVLRGPYRFTRNPMYLGLLTMLIGLASAVDTWPMILPPLAFFVVISTVFIPCEERWMSHLFGDEFRRYCGTVRRWV